MKLRCAKRDGQQRRRLREHKQDARVAHRHQLRRLLQSMRIRILNRYPVKNLLHLMKSGPIGKKTKNKKSIDLQAGSGELNHNRAETNHSMSDFCESVIALINLLNEWVDKIDTLGNEDDSRNFSQQMQVINAFDDNRVGAQLVELVSNLATSTSLTGTIRDVNLLYGNQPFNESHFVVEMRHAVSLLWNCTGFYALLSFRFP
jgi:hypothetical protein